MVWPPETVKFSRRPLRNLGLLALEILHLQEVGKRIRKKGQQIKLGPFENGYLGPLDAAHTQESFFSGQEGAWLNLIY